MHRREDLLDELVVANRILATQGVVDAYGHISVRISSDRFLLSRARAPECIEPADIMEFNLDGSSVDAQGRQPYLERFIHGAIYELRSDVHSVVHNHSHNLIPFGVIGKALRPIAHTATMIGKHVPVWDCSEVFGDTDLLVSNMDMGRDLARRLGTGTVALMRGHGATVTGRSIREAVHTSVYLQLNADLQLKAALLAEGGPIKFLSDGEIDVRNATHTATSYDRAWEIWRRLANI
jgi:ribulose-5-phosphate 4-epimerase/fuculose-1-phosphate aldolase